MVMLQVRHLPEEVHRVLKARAARRGMSLSDYVRGELERLADRPTLDEIHERLRQRDLALGTGPLDVSVDFDAMHRERGDHLASIVRQTARPE